MKFYYTAAQNDGKIIKGELIAKGSSEALAILASRGLKPISLKKDEGIVSLNKRIGFFNSISIYDKIFLTKYLALMLRTGSDLFKAIDILISDFTKQSVRAFLFEVRENLEKGQPFYLAFSRYPRYFSQVFVNLIKAGEVSGNLENTFERLSANLQKEQELRQQIRAALVYPILLIVGATLVIFLIIAFSLPKVAALFSDSGFEPPVFSKIVFAIGAFLNNYFLFILIIVIFTALAFWVLIVHSNKFRKIFQHFLRKLPILGKLLQTISIQRFSATFASLITSGVPILEALEITAQVMGDENIKGAVIRVAREGVAKGLTIGEAFKREPAFPNTVSNLIAISEKSGNLSDILSTLAEFYESEVKTSIKVLISFLEPALLFFIGITIAIIALAVIIPIYQLIGSF